MKDIYSIDATTKMRIEDIIQFAFDAETEDRGKVVPKRSKEEEQQIKEEEKAVFLWIMKVLHEKKPQWITVWYDYFDSPGNMHLDWHLNRYNEPKEYISKYGKGYIAFEMLIPKMVATGKAKVLEYTGSYKKIGFSFI